MSTYIHGLSCGLTKRLFDVKNYSYCDISASSGKQIRVSWRYKFDHLILDDDVARSLINNERNNHEY
jgi:hypothetical protein